MPQQRVDIPGVGIVEFPVDMSGEDIDAASKRLYNESLGPMKWPPGEPAPAPSMFDMDYRRPTVTPEARAATAAAAPDPSLPTATDIAGGDIEAIPEPRRSAIREGFMREGETPIIPFGEMAERAWPDRPDAGLAYQWERGFGVGINRLAAGFTTPFTIATIGAAMGAGAVSQTLKILVGMGFTSHIAADAIVRAPEIVQMVKEGRTSEAVAAATEVTGSLLLAGTIGRHTLKATAAHPAVTGRAMVLDPRVPPEPQVTFEQGRGLEVLPAHEAGLFPGRPTELPGTPAAGALAEIPRPAAPGIRGPVSTQGLYGRGAPPEPEVRGLLPEAPGYDIPGAGEGRIFRGGARMGEPAPTLEGEPGVAGVQTVTPTGRPRGLFGDEPSNVLRRQRLAPDFVGPLPEALVRPEPGPGLLPAGPDIALPPGGGPLVTRVQPGEPGGLDPFRPADIVPTGRPGVPARVREPGRFRLREPGDPSHDLLTDEPMVEREGLITQEVVPEAPVERELTLGEAIDRRAEEGGPVKIVKPYKTRWEIGQDWYKENSMELAIVDEGGMKLDMNVTEEAAMVMPNLGATRDARGRNMFDPIRTLKGEGGHTPDQMFHILQEGGKIPENWTQEDFMAAMSDRQPGSKGTFPNVEGADVFDLADAEAEARTPPEFRGEVEPGRVTPEVPERVRAVGEPPRTVEEAEADFQRGRQEIEALRNNPGYAGTDFEALETEIRVTRQENIDRIQPPKPTTRGPGFAEEPRAGIPPRPEDRVTGETFRKETFAEMNARLEAVKEGYQAQTDAFREAHGEVGFQVPMEGEGRYIILAPSARPESIGKWQATYFDKGGPSGHHIENTWAEAIKDLQDNYRIDLSEARVKSMENLDRAMTDMSGYDLEAEAARDRRARGLPPEPVEPTEPTAPTEPTVKDEVTEFWGDRPVPDELQAEWNRLDKQLDTASGAERAKILKRLEEIEMQVGEETFPELAKELKDAEAKADAITVRETKDGFWEVILPDRTVNFVQKANAEAFAAKERAGEPAAEEFPERVGMKEEPKVTPETGPDLERLRKGRETPRERLARIRQETREAVEGMTGFEGRAERQELIDQVERDQRAGPDVGDMKLPAEPTVKPAPQWEIKKTQGGDWGVYKDGNLQIRKATEAEAADSMRGIQDSGEEGSFTYTEEQFDPGRKEGREFWRTKPTEPEEPAVTPEGQVEIVGQRGFERQNKLADDKAKLEALLSAKPDQTTAAGRKFIRDLGRREKFLRAEIAEQERLLRNEPEQAGMFAEDEPPLFQREPTVKPETPEEEKVGLFAEEPKVEAEGRKPEAPPEQAKSRAQDYVDSLARSKAVEPELADFAQAYLDWKLGDKKLPAPRMPGNLARSFRDLIDTLVESEKPPTALGDQSTLYSNPIGYMMDVWSKNYGPKLWKFLASTEEPYGVVVKPWPEFVKWLFITRHRQPPEWVEAHQQWEWTTADGRTESFKLGKQMSQGLSQADQLKLGKLLRGEATEADLRAMRDNPRWQEAVDAVKTARARFDEWGSQAVVQGLLKEETFFKNYGRYMPRLYRRWEADYEGQLKKWGVKRPTRIDMDRWKKQGDIPEEIRVLMGEILEPGYPVAKGLSQIIQSVETAKLFNLVAKHPDWTFEPEKFWDLGKDPNKYTKMPVDPKLGALSGKFVNKYIASEINQMVKPRGQYNKVSRALVSEWKFNKVIFNPATHGRNMVSNTMLAYLSGLPPWRIDIYAKAMQELWQEKGPHYDLAKEQGLFSTTFARGELDSLMDAWNSTQGGFYDRIAGMADHFAKGEIAEGLGKVRPSGWKVGQRAAKIYQGEEAWFKLAKFIQETEAGATPKAAAKAAQKALFDYTEVPPFVEWARTSPVGAPFITFTYKALPQIIETGITHPWRLGGLVAGIYAMEEGARLALGIDEIQLDFLKRIMPDRMKGDPLGLGPKALLLPYKDRYGQLMFLDLTYILPWGDIGETGASGILQGTPGYAGPLRAIAEVMLNTSGFTGKVIYEENDSTKVKVQKVSDYIYKWALPSLAPAIPGVTKGGYGFERLWSSGMGVMDPTEDYFGRVSTPATAIASAIIGLKTNPFDPQIQIFFRRRHFETAFEDLEAGAYRIRNHRGLSLEEKQNQLEELQKKAQTLRGIADEMFRGPMDERE